MFILSDDDDIKTMIVMMIMIMMMLLMLQDTKDQIDLSITWLKLVLVNYYDHDYHVISTILENDDDRTWELKVTYIDG